MLAAATALGVVGCGSDGVQVTVGDTGEPPVVSVGTQTGSVDASARIPGSVPVLRPAGRGLGPSVASIRTAADADPCALEPALTEFMAQLGDGHTTLDWLPIDPAVEGFSMPELETLDDVIAVMDDEFDTTLARVDGLRTDPTGAVGWGTLDDSIGYLLLAGFEGSVGDGDPVAGRDVLVAAMDAAISDLNTRADRLVVDVRFNQGGYEDLAVLVAGYFVDEDTPRTASGRTRSRTGSSR